MTTDNFCFYLQNRLIQTGQTAGQQHSDTSPYSIPCLNHFIVQLCWLEGINKDPTVWLVGVRPPC